MPFLARFAAALAFSAALAGPALAAFTLSGTPKVAFYAVGSPSFLDIEGVTNTVTLNDDGTNLVFTVPMNSVKTGIELRDDHMNEHYVEVGKFPTVALSVPRAGVTWPANVGEEAKGTTKAQFTAHGVPVEVDVAYTVKKTKTGYRVTAKFPFDISKHGISVPSYLGITVENAMNVQATVDLAGA